MTANHIARMTAKRLMPKFGDALPLTVEQVIQSAPAQPGEFIDFGTLAAIAALIVQCAQLAFDLKRSKGGGKKLRSSSPEGDSANNLRSSSPEGDSANNLRSSSPEGDSANKLRSSSPEGDSANKLRSSSPEGDSANKLDKEALKRELRLELGLPEGVSEKTRDEVIDAVAEETEARE